MNSFFVDDAPIAACSSGLGRRCAVSLIRLSGFQDLDDLAPFLTFGTPFPEGRRAVLCDLVDGDKTLDRVLFTHFKAPHSFTGENVAEIGVHGNVINVERILDVLTSKGPFRLAKAGEFSYRALKNGKISLSEAEGLDLFFHSSSKDVLDRATKLMGGELSSAYRDLRTTFLELQGALELSMDFLEDVGEEGAQRQWLLAKENFSSRLKALAQRFGAPLSKLLSPDIVLLGPPNSGKSSLFNRFLQTSRSIVSPTEGTTRDYVSEAIFIRGTEFRLIDTAGIREGGEEIEKEGMERSMALAAKAFFKILLIDPRRLTSYELKPFEKVHFDLVLLTHADLPEDWAPLSLPLDFAHFAPICLKAGPIEPGKIEIQTAPIEPPPSTGSIEPLPNGPIGPRSLKALEDMIVNKYLKLLENNDILVPRQRELITKALARWNDFEKLTIQEKDPAILSSELSSIGHILEELVGESAPEEVLEAVFSRFCIGK
ncbi:MAG: GTP-binding protein [Bacteriovoracales bacterium]|nr:GTP-binding protein [Bacteriovoracales bacterium]